MNRFRCSECGYECYGKNSPDICPDCRAPRRFMPVSDTLGYTVYQPVTSAAVPSAPPRHALKYKCLVCGGVTVSATIPMMCTFCQSGGNVFSVQN